MFGFVYFAGRMHGGLDTIAGRRHCRDWSEPSSVTPSVVLSPIAVWLSVIHTSLPGIMSMRVQQALLVVDPSKWKGTTLETRRCGQHLCYNEASEFLVRKLHASSF